MTEDDARAELSRLSGSDLRMLLDFLDHIGPHNLPLLADFISTLQVMLVIGKWAKWFLAAACAGAVLAYHLLGSWKMVRPPPHS